MRSGVMRLAPLCAVALVLSGCTGTVGAPPTAAPSTSAASSATSSATSSPSGPSVPTATPVPTPSETPYVDPDGPTPEPIGSSSATGSGCTDSGPGVPAGAATTQIPDIDGDGKPDTQFLTTSAPFRYGIRTSAGGTYTVEDGLPQRGVHSAWITGTDSGLGYAVVIDDGSTATLHSFMHCTLTTLRTTDGDPFTLPLRRSPERSTGVACTNQNGGTLIAAEETRRRDDGTYDVFQALVQFAKASNPSAGDDEVGLDDFAPPARYTGLSADDPRVLQASGSFCWAAPERVQIRFDRP